MGEKKVEKLNIHEYVKMQKYDDYIVIRFFKIQLKKMYFAGDSNFYVKLK